MRFKRQPTIKTLLLLTAVYAVQAATIRSLNYVDNGYFAVVAASSVIIWLLPLCFLLFFSMRHTAALCFAIAITNVALSWFIRGRGFGTLEHVVVNPYWFFLAWIGCESAMAPMLWMELQLSAWLDQPSPADWIAHILWPPAFVATAFLFSKTLRQRQQDQRQHHRQ